MPCPSHGPACLDDRAPKRAEPCADAGREGAGEGERDADPERRQRAREADRPRAADQEPHAHESNASPERACEEADGRALCRGERENIFPRGASGPKQGEVTTVALDRPERGEIRQPERHESTRHGEHDVERLGVERVSRRGAEAVAEVVHELDPPGE